METYWGLHADEIRFADFWSFAFQHRVDLARYLRWVDRMQSGKSNSIKIP